MSEVWISAADGDDLIRADAIVILRMDRTGRLTVQLRDEAKVNVTLLEGSPGGARPPADFHRQLIRLVTELAGSGGPRLVRARQENGAWHWTSENL
ncbi:hypothetical protein GWI34_16265 [Actinomadura sp. DSM 109109]|nr:hypothetical protein [Actinomadura lepetitiana]